MLNLHLGNKNIIPALVVSQYWVTTFYNHNSLSPGDFYVSLDIGPCYDVLPDRFKAITWTNIDVLFIETLGTKLTAFSVETKKVVFKNNAPKIPSVI